MRVKCQVAWHLVKFTFHFLRVQWSTHAELPSGKNEEVPSKAQKRTLSGGVGAPLRHQVPGVPSSEVCA